MELTSTYATAKAGQSQGYPKFSLQHLAPAVTRPPIVRGSSTIDRRCIYISRLAIYNFLYIHRTEFRISNTYISSTQLSSRTIASAGAGPGGVIVMYLHNATNAPTRRAEARRIDAVSNKYSAASYPKSNKPIKRFYKASCAYVMYVCI